MNSYKDELQRVRLTDDAKHTLAARLCQPMPQEAAARPRRRLSRAAVCAIAVCAASLTLCAAALLSGTLREFWGADSAVVYDDNHQMLNLSQTVEGWTVTLTDAVCDAQHAYIGFTVDAPQGETLQKTMKWPNPDTGLIEDRKTEYSFEDNDIKSAMRDGVISTWGIRRLPDDNPNDNRLYFAFDLGSRKEFNHDSYNISLSGLHHMDDWDPTPRWDGGFWNEHGWFKSVPDVSGTFSFQNVRIDCPDSTRRIPWNRAVPLYDGTATLTSAELSPLSLTLHYEGDIIRGLFDRETIWRRDGLQTCSLPVTLHFKDGTELPLASYGTFGGVPVWYCGGAGSRDNSDKGTMDCVIPFDQLIDPDTIDHFTVGDAVIPVATPAAP